jgi:hypothetical protein
VEIGWNLWGFLPHFLPQRRVVSRQNAGLFPAMARQNRRRQRGDLAVGALLAQERGTPKSLVEVNCVLCLGAPGTGWTLACRHGAEIEREKVGRRRLDHLGDIDV